jgi:hypothetical protein
MNSIVIGIIRGVAVVEAVVGRGVVLRGGRGVVVRIVMVAVTVRQDRVVRLVVAVGINVNRVMDLARRKGVGVKVVVRTYHPFHS